MNKFDRVDYYINKIIEDVDIGILVLNSNCKINGQKYKL